MEVKNIPYLEKYGNEFINSEYPDVEKVEPLLVIYRITPTGLIEQEIQNFFKYDIDYLPDQRGQNEARTQ